MKLKYIDLFAGCGGLSSGLYSSKKWKGIFAIEKSPNAFLTLKHNLIDNNNHFKWPDTIPCKNLDINDVICKYEEVLSQKIEDVDLVAGGPPCQGFSTNGKRIESDSRNSLISSYVQFIRMIQPRVILFENVRGFVKKFDRNKDKGINYSEFVKEELEYSSDSTKGYFVSGRLLDFGDFGIPQRRVRYILIGVRKDVGSSQSPDDIFDLLSSGKKTFLKNKGIKASVNLSDAISDLKRKNVADCPDSHSFKSGLYNNIESNYQKLMRANVNDDQIPDSHRFVNHREGTIKKFEYILRNSVKNKTIDSDTKNKFNTSKRTTIPLDGDKKSLTISTLPDDYIHYSEPRILTVREYARIQSFSDCYEFKGKYTTGGKNRVLEVPRYSQIGNAIPPLFGEQIGLAISKFLKNVR